MLEAQESSPEVEARGPATDVAVYQRYLPLVRRIAMRTVRRLPPEVSLDDVLGAGWMGLAEALRRRTAQMNEEQFEAYASHRIRGAILDHLRSLDPLSRKMRGVSRRIAAAVRTLTGRFGRLPAEEEIAGELGLDIEGYRELVGRVSEVDGARLELTEYTGDRSPPESRPDFLASRREAVQKVTEAIDGLPERLKTVLGLYYQDDCSLREIGEILGVTESRVCQMHSEAVQRIRGTIDEGAEPRLRRTR
jgi:RNA polymerase sigma factor for flagellar operon FliA